MASLKSSSGLPQSLPANDRIVLYPSTDHYNFLANRSTSLFTIMLSFGTIATYVAKKKTLK
jgi:hypothetical protein